MQIYIYDIDASRCLPAHDLMVLIDNQLMCAVVAPAGGRR